MRNILFALLILLASMLSSCIMHTYTHTLSKDEAFISSKVRMTGWKKIAILPFSGEPVSRRVSAELFSYYLQEQSHFEVIGPAISEIELKKRDIVIAETAPSVKDILHMGEILGADAIIAGSIKGENYTHVVKKATLFDVGTGKIIIQDEEVINGVYATPIKYSAYEILTVLYELAGDHREFQILKERPLDTMLKKRPFDTDEGELY